MKLEKYSGNPILKKNPNNSWEELCVLNPAVIYSNEDKKFYMLYRAAGNDKQHYIYIGLATSLFIPLIVVNCIIIGRAESFASKNGVGASALDGIFQGLGYTLVLIVMCIIREFLGKGTFGGGLIDVGEAGVRFVTDGSGSGIRIFPAQYGALLMVLPFGGFLTLGTLIAIVQGVTNRKHNKEIRAGKLSVIAALDAAHGEEGGSDE